MSNFKRNYFWLSESCGTLFNFSHPKTIHDYGRQEGAWMRDFYGNEEDRDKVFITNFYYGSNLIEFRSISDFR